MGRICFRLWLKPDPAGIETYVWHHLNPFPSLYDRIRAAGISRYTIWLDGTDLMLTREGKRPWAHEELDLSDPVQQAWVDTMRPLFQERVAKDGASVPARIDQQDHQRPAGPAQMTFRVPLRPGAEAVATVSDAYRAVTPAVRDATRSAGVMRAWAWVEEGDLWIYRECADLDATEVALAADPTYQAWWGTLEPGLAGPPRRTREVFRCD
jgi:L-rhamnose mutarotase